MIKHACCSFDKEVQKFAEFIDKFTEEVKQQLEFSDRAATGLQQLLNSINSRLDGKSEDSEIEHLKALLRNVLSKATNYRNACVQAAQKGSKKSDIEQIKHEIKKGRFQLLFEFVNDMLSKFECCSQCLNSLESECKCATQSVRSTRDTAEANKRNAESGKTDSTIATSTGAIVTALGIGLSLFVPPVGIAVAGVGLATTAGGAIGLAVHDGRLDQANKVLGRVASLSGDLESVKRRVSAVSTTMDECEESISGVNQSGERAAKRGTVTFAIRRKIESSLDSMYSQFEVLIEKHL